MSPLGPNQGKKFVRTSKRFLYNRSFGEVTSTKNSCEINGSRPLFTSLPPLYMHSLPPSSLRIHLRHRFNGFRVRTMSFSEHESQNKISSPSPAKICKDWREQARHEKDRRIWPIKILQKLNISQSSTFFAAVLSALCSTDGVNMNETFGEPRSSRKWVRKLERLQHSGCLGGPLFRAAVFDRFGPQPGH